jgi:hypothetical protein
MLRPLSVLMSSLYVLSFCSIAAAQVDVEVDAAHHKLEFQNDCVRVVRAIFGPHEKSAGFFDTMDAVIVEITGSERWQVNFPNGNSVTAPASPAGRVWWAPGGGRIQPYNISDKRVEYLVIEPNGKGCHQRT